MSEHPYNPTDPASNGIPNLPADAVFLHDGKPATTSLKVAEYFGKRHDHVIRDIRALIEDCPPEFSLPNFGEMSYTDSQGREYPMYYMTFPGFMLLVMGFTGKKALGIKVAYVNAFEAMAAQIQALSARQPACGAFPSRLADELRSCLERISEQDEKIAALANSLDFRIRKIFGESVKKAMAALDSDASAPEQEPVFGDLHRDFVAFVEADRKYFERPRTIRELAGKGFEPAKDTHRFKHWLKIEDIATVGARIPGRAQKYFFLRFPNSWLPHLRTPEIGCGEADATTWQ